MDTEDKKTEPEGAAPRRPYQPPRVEESATFEHLVLACGHTSSLSLPCNPKKGGTTRS
jgi:hypothetical protein